MKLKLSILLIFLFLSNCGIKPEIKFTDQIISKPSYELRGATITIYEWANPDSSVMKSNIIKIMQNLGNANFNTVFFQVRAQAETFYPSPIEPWSKIFNFTDPGFNPVTFAIKEAHKNNLQFYANINLLALWDENKPPLDTNHLFHKHGPNVKPENSWVCMDNVIRSMKKNDSFYLNPALPEVKNYLKKVIKQFVKNYNIDGLNFEKIQYPDNDYQNNPDSLKKYNKDSLNTKISNQNWTQKQLTELIEAVVVEAMLIKPYLITSATTFGMFKTKNTEENNNSKSRHDKYYKDAIEWLDRGIVDFIVPIFNCNIDTLLPNYDDLWINFKKRTTNYRHIYPGICLKNSYLKKDEIKNQLDNIRKNGGQGAVIFTTDPNSNENINIIKNKIFSQKIELPLKMKRRKSNQFFSIDFKNSLNDTITNKSIKLLFSNKTRSTDSEGKISFIAQNIHDTLLISSQDNILKISTNHIHPPYSFIANSDNTISRKSPWVEMRKFPKIITAKNEFDFLFKTEYPCKVSINSIPAKIYKTGIFFNKVKFNEGKNRIRAEITTKNSETTFYEQEFIYKKSIISEPDTNLWIDEKSIFPNSNMILLPSDNIYVSFKAKKGQNATVIINPGNQIFKLTQDDKDDYSIYKTDIPLYKFKKNQIYNLTFTIFSKSQSEISKSYQSPFSIQIKDLDQFPLVKTIEENSVFNYAMGKIRLGGPIRIEYPKNIILKTSGKIGNNYRIQLSKIEHGFIKQEFVKELPIGTPKPSYFINSMYCKSTKTEDMVFIPYLENIPYTISPEPHINRITITLFGAKTNCTWITHLKKRKYIENVTWEQTTPETYKIYINLKSNKIWGYSLKPKGRSLIFKIKNAPKLNLTKEKPLNGLKIAIEAGHGGKNLGAVGLSGTLEKSINLDLAKKLEKICKQNGAKVYQVRNSDKYMFLGEKRDSVLSSNSDIFISIHANAGGKTYLGVSGTSTYYNNPFWAAFAEKTYDNLLELNLDEFGIIGAFNYKVIRISEMPSILVEQAFLSNAIDEEKLTNEKFRAKMATKIYEGIVDYLKYLNEK